MVGSEGTLGIITDIAHEIHREAEGVRYDRCRINSLKDAGQCVSNIIAKPLLPSAIELMDSVCIKAVNKCMNIGLPDCEALCIIEVDRVILRGG